ncbi:MAG: hypothetical protein RL021_1054, partial [Bacteroidota bacterium]
MTASGLPAFNPATTLTTQSMTNRDLNLFSNHVLMVRPSGFYGNPETKTDNHFQENISSAELADQAMKEFERMVEMLHQAGIETTVFDCNDGIDTPDAVFPNNWFSAHRNGTIVLYPMKAPNRRRERREVIIEWLSSKYEKLLDLSPSESSGRYLEGTGSLVLDRQHRIAFAAVSERTDPTLVTAWCEQTDYRPCLFKAFDRDGKPVYHTNVVLSIGHGFTLAALDCIVDESERNAVQDLLKTDDRTIVRLSIDQLHAFAGNGLQLTDATGIPVFILSKTGWNSLNESQRQSISSRTKVVIPDVPVIERIGGGSVRC